LRYTKLKKKSWSLVMKLKTAILLLTSISNFFTAYAKDFAFPTLPKSGETITEFIPEGWSLKDSSSGDLNGDGLDDLAFVIEYKNNVDELRPDSTVLNTNPRIMVVMLKKRSSYKLFIQNNTFILRNGEGGVDPEPYDRIRIDKGLLSIKYKWVRGFTLYKFSMQDNTLCLVQAINNNVSSGSFEGWDFNFLTGKAKHSWGEIGDDKTREELKDLPPAKLKELKELSMPFRWEVLPGVRI
jgi:hypothetical protein